MQENTQESNLYKREKLSKELDVIEIPEGKIYLVDCGGNGTGKRPLFISSGFAWKDLIAETKKIFEELRNLQNSQEQEEQEEQEDNPDENKEEPIVENTETPNTSKTTKTKTKNTKK